MVPAAVLALTLIAGLASAARDLTSAIAAGAYDGFYSGRVANNCRRGSNGPYIIISIENGRIEGYIRGDAGKGAIEFDQKLAADGRLSLSRDWKHDSSYNFSAEIVEAGLKVAMRWHGTWGSCRGVKVFARPAPMPSNVAAARPQTPARGDAERATPPMPMGPVEEKAPPPKTPAPVAGRPVTARDAAPPVIAAPRIIETEAAIIELAGTVRDQSRVVDLSLDGQPIALGAGGGFNVRRGVPLGESQIALVAVDEWGNSADRVVRVVRRRPAAAQVAIAGDSAAPVIDVPARLETAEATVALAGKVADASRVAELTVDDRPIALASDGSFAVKRGVGVGRTSLKLAAVDEWGNRSERRVQVTRLTPAEALGIDFGRYHALVIGNDDYRHLPRLRTAVADAEAVAAALQDDYGFEVELLLNASHYDITAAVSRLRRALTPADNLLVYYAGHGVVDREIETGFWLPVDAEPHIDSYWIANDYVSRNLRAMTAKHVLVVADSCYSGTLVRAGPQAISSGAERDVWLTRMAEKRSRTALTSGGLEPVMDSGGGDHSVFAKAFLAALSENDGVLDGQTLFAALRRPVVVNSDQTPQYSDIRRAGHDGGDFLFVRR